MDPVAKQLEAERARLALEEARLAKAREAHEKKLLAEARAADASLKAEAKERAALEKRLLAQAREADASLARAAKEREAAWQRVQKERAAWEKRLVAEARQEDAALARVAKEDEVARKAVAKERAALEKRLLAQAREADAALARATKEREAAKKAVEKERVAQEKRLLAQARAEDALLAKAAKEREAAAKRADQERAAAEKRLAAEARDLAKRQRELDATASRLAREREEEVHRTVRAWFDAIRDRLRAAQPLVKPFAASLASLANGLDGEGGFGGERLARLPPVDLATVLRRCEREWAQNRTVPEDVLRDSVDAFDAQVRRIALWNVGSAESPRLLRQGDAGFNRHATRVLERLGVDGARTCLAPPPGEARPPMLHQAATRSLLHPLSPMRRALVVHPTGTGKSRVLLQVLDNYFHDRRAKVVLAPSYLILLQIARDMIDLLPDRSSPLKRWYGWWLSQQSDAVRAAGAASPRPAWFYWHVIAALGFQEVITRGGGGGRPRSAAHEDDDLEAVAHDTGEADDDVRPLETRADVSRLNTLDQLRSGERTPKMLNASHELRAPVVFLTYAEHRLGTYRETRAFARSDGGPVVSFDRKIVLVDEMHNLFDQRNPNLNAVQRRKLFGDDALRAREEKRLAAATDPASQRRAREAVLIYTGLSKILKSAQQAVVVGLTATPIVEVRGDGARAAKAVLEWVRGAKQKGGSGGGGGGNSGSGGGGSGSDSEGGALPSLADGFEGYVSYFGARPSELFARADETSFPSLEPVVVSLPADAFEPMGGRRGGGEEEEEREEGDRKESLPPWYGIRGLRSLHGKYTLAKRASAWMTENAEMGWYRPKGEEGVTVEYWGKSRAWSGGGGKAWTLHRAEERMPAWGEGLLPFGRAPPRRGESAWWEGGGNKTACWIESDSPSHTEAGHEVTVGDSDETVPCLGRNGKVSLLVANRAKPLFDATWDGGVARVRIRPDGGVEFVAATEEKEGTQKKKASAPKRAEGRSFLLPVPAHLPRATLTVEEEGGGGALRVVAQSPSLSLSRSAFVLVLHAKRGLLAAVPNGTLKQVAKAPLDDVEYEPNAWFYEEDQLLRYDARLTVYERDEAGKWLNVFYGGRELRSAQARAGLGPPDPVPCSGLAGLRQAGAAPDSLTGFAVDMARHLVPLAMTAWEGKVLWLLSEAHGLALVERWLQCDERARRWAEEGRIRLFGAYRAEERRGIAAAAGHFLDATFNAAGNERGDRCKLLIGGAGDLGTGVTFSELRHVVLDLTGSYFQILQQMGRAVRLCKHARLPPDERSVQFHLPVPVLTTGWGGALVEAARPGGKVVGGLGAARVQLDDFVPRLQVQTRKETLSAPLHVPHHVFDTLVDLHRSRAQFLAGMRLFARVAVDGEFYARRAGWRLPEALARAADPTDEPLTRKAAEPVVRDRVSRSVVLRSGFGEEGLSRLRRESDSNAAYNADVLARVRRAEEAEGPYTRADAAERVYYDLVRKHERREENAVARAQKEEEKAQRDRERAAREAAKAEEARRKEEAREARERAKAEEARRREEEARSLAAAFAERERARAEERARKEEERVRKEEEKARRAAEREAAAAQKERERAERAAREEALLSDCANYRVAPSTGSFKRRDKGPSHSADQARARRAVDEGVARGDPDCVRLREEMDRHERARVAREEHARRVAEQNERLAQILEARQDRTQG